MAELKAIGKDLKDLTPVTKKNPDGSANMKLEGDPNYHPELILSTEDVLNFMAAITTKEPPPLPKPTGVIVGVNGGYVSSGTIISAGIKSERLGFNPESILWSSASLAQSKLSGFSNQTVIVGNINDGQKLSTVNIQQHAASVVAQAKLCSGVLVLEDVNEPQFKGGIKDPKTYAHMYVADKKALVSAGITLPLGFTLFGNFQEPNGSWPAFNWLADAVAVEPELPKLCDCLIHHTYGKVGESIENNLGTKALEDSLNRAVEMGFKRLVYVTEYGCQMIPGQSNYKIAPDEAGQAQVVKSVSEKLISIPGVKGIWPYAVRDGVWSFLPATLAAIGAIARAH